MPIIDQLSGPTPKNLSLEGNKLTNISPFENEGQAYTSDIQALVGGRTLVSSQDLLRGRISTQIPDANYFKPASTPPVSVPSPFEGNPFYPALGGIGGGGTYKDNGPSEGRY